jgi:hypothetical protein
LRLWEPLIRGVDIHESFVRLARARLVIAAAARSPYVKADVPDLDETFRALTVGSGPDRMLREGVPNWTMMNPPFGRVAAPPSCEWATGAVSEAAAFVDSYLSAAKPGQRLVAILPDVLRTGATLRAWRECVQRMAVIEVIQPLGQFNRDVDIDVFVLRLRRARTATRNAVWWAPAVRRGRVPVSSVATVRVGTVVPHRDPKKGQFVPFLHAQNLARRAIASTPVEKRRYAGPLFVPPFIAIRRTSRPGDRPRALATVVTGTSSIAVENHLLVVTPKKQSMAACRRLAQELMEPRASQWLDQRLRGRHLTVTALNELTVRS